MAKITYVEQDGTGHEADIKPGFTVMEGALHNDVPGIIGQCGGGCACATCHIYVPEAWQALTGERSEMEASMLEYAMYLRKNSRLSCQIRVTEAMDGMVVHLPGPQD